VEVRTVAKEFDADLNHLTDAHPDQWARFLGDRLGIPPGPVEVLDTDLATTVQADKLFRVGGRVPAVIHVEFEVSGHFGRPADLVRYNVLAHHQARLPVHSVVVLLRPKADSSDLTGEFQLTGADGRPYLSFRYGVLRVWQESVDALLGAGLGLAPLVLLTDESARDPIGTVGRVQAELRRVELPANVEASLLNSLFLLGALRHERDQIRELFRRVAMSIDLRESSYYQMILDEGRMVEAQNTLLRLAGKKFGAVPAPVEAAVRGLTDRERIERMTDRIFEAADWDDLLATA
jgi:hypothetical protein